MSRCFPTSSDKPPTAVGSQLKNQSVAAANRLAPPLLAEQSIFTSASPPRRETVKVGYFLDACALCKTEILESKDRYMYGYLQAFCSTGCRDDQIALDEMSKPPSPRRRNVSSKGKRSRR